MNFLKTPPKWKPCDIEATELCRRGQREKLTALVTISPREAKTDTVLGKLLRK